MPITTLLYVGTTRQSIFVKLFYLNSSPVLGKSPKGDGVKTRKMRKPA